MIMIQCRNVSWFVIPHVYMRTGRLVWVAGADLLVGVRRFEKQVRPAPSAELAE